MIPRCLLLLTLTVSFSWALEAQESSTLKELERQRTELQSRLRESESLLSRTSTDIRSQMGQLDLINAQLAEEQSYIETLTADIGKIDAELGRLRGQVAALESELRQSKQNYASSVNYLHRNRSIQEKLMFIVSADNLQQMYRRLRYVREYAQYQKRQADEVVRKRQQVLQKQQEVASARDAKQQAAKQKEQAAEKLLTRQNQQKKLVQSLRSKQKSLQSEVSKARRQQQELSERIDRLIQEEIARSQDGGKSGAVKSAPSRSGTSKTAVSKGFKLSNDEEKLSGSFQSNRGKLPVPITGPYLIVSHFGKYNVAGLKNVTLDSKGIDIQGQDGALARAVFDGKVVSVFQLNGLMNVLIRHGAYISVYCNLSAVSVKNGQDVSARQQIGKVAKEASGRTVLHFQLRKEKEKLNPEPWLTKR